MGGVADKLSGLLPDARLSYAVTGDLSQHLLSIKLDVLQNPKEAVDRLPVLEQIANVMDGKKP